MLSNGTLITPNVAKELYQKGVNHIQVSLDGAKKRHEKIRGVPGCYEKALEGIVNSEKAGIPTNISMTAMKSNIADFEDVILAGIEAGAQSVCFQSYVPSLTQGASDPEYLDAIETKKLFSWTSNLVKKYKSQIRVLQTEVLWQIMQEDNPLKKFARENMKYLNGCSAGYFTLSVLSNGDVYPCRRLPINIGHIDQGIKNLILKSEVMKNLRDLEKLKENTGCDMVYHCRGCRAIAYAINGDYLSKDPMCFKGK